MSDRKNLLASLTNLQRYHCCYDLYPYHKAGPPPTMCDCKYGAHIGIDNSEAHCGCPELRVVAELVHRLSSAEIDEILKRTPVKE